MKRNAHILVHKASSLLLSILMLLSNMTPAVAYAIEDKAKYSEDEYFEYELTESGYKIKGLKEKSKYLLEENDFTLTIPESHNDIPVIGLGKNSLQNEKIKKLNLPNTIKEIDDFAIYKDEKGDGLKKINIYPEQRDEETGEVIKQRINIERIGEKAIENQNLKDLPFNVRILEESSLKNNNFTKLDLSDTEIIRKDSLTQEGELNLIVNKYSDIEQPFYNEEKTKVEYIEKEFNKKETDSTDVDYLAIRQKALSETFNNKKEEKSTEEDEESEEDSHSEEDENEKVKYKIKKHRSLDEILDDSNLVLLEELDKREFNTIRKHKTPDRFSLLPKAYAVEEIETTKAEDTRIESVGYKWILGEEDGNRYLTEEDTTLKWHKETEGYIRVKTDVAFSGEQEIDTGMVQVTVPKYLFTDRKNKKAGYPTIGLAPLPSVKNAFAYYDTGNEYVIINTKPISAATSLSFEMTFRGINPHEIKDSLGEYPFKFRAKAELTNATGEKFEMEGNKGIPLKVGVDTKTIIENATKKSQIVYDDGYPDKWPNNIKPKNPDDYIYVEWKASAVNRGSQPFKVSLTENANTADYTKGVKVLGIRRDSDMTIIGSGENEVNIEQVYPINNDYEYMKDGVNFYTTIYTAYPKANFFDNNGQPKEKEYILKNKITYTLTSEDDQEVTNTPNEGSIKFTPKPFKVPETYFKIKKRGSSDDCDRTGDRCIQYNVGLNFINRGIDVDADYNVEALIVGEKFTKPEGINPFGIEAYGRKEYTSIVRDEEVLFNGRKLEKDEYQFNGIRPVRIQPYRYQRQYKEWNGMTVENGRTSENTTLRQGDWGYRELGNNESLREPAISVVYDQNGVMLAKIKHNTILNKEVETFNGATYKNGFIKFPEGVTGYEVRVTSKESAYKLFIQPSVRIKATDKIMKESANLFTEKIREAGVPVDNKVTLKIKEDPNFNDESQGTNYLKGEYYINAYPEGHFMIWKWGEGQVDGNLNLSKPLDGKTNFDYRLRRGIYPYHLNEIKNGKEVEVFYEVETDGFGMSWTYDESKNEEVKRNNPNRKEKYVDEAFNQKAYTMTSRDEKLWFNDGEQLSEDDYEFTKIKLKDPVMFDYVKFENGGVGFQESNQTRFNGVIAKGKIFHGDYGYKETEDFEGKSPTLVISGRNSKGQYVKYGEAKFNSKTSYTLKAFNGAKTDNDYLVFPAGTTGYKIDATTKLDGFKWNHLAYVKLKQSNTVKNMAEQAFENSDTPSSILNNEVSLDLILDDTKSKGVVKKVGVDELRGVKHKRTEPGNHFSVKKEGYGSYTKRINPKDSNSDLYGYYPMFLNRILNNDKDAEISYKVHNRGFGMPFTYDEDKDITDSKSFNQVPYTMISKDDYVDFNGEELNKEDFSFTGIRFERPKVYDYIQYSNDGYGYYESFGGIDWRYSNITGGVLGGASNIYKGQYGYKVTNDYSKLGDFEIWAASDDNVYRQYGTVRFSNNNIPLVKVDNVDGGHPAKIGGRGDEIRFPEEDNITKYKIIAKTTQAAVEWTHEPKVKFKKTKKIENIINKLYETSDIPEVEVNNKVELTVKTGKDEEETFINTSKGMDKLDGMIYGAKTSKYLTKHYNDAENQVVELDYTLKTDIQTNVKNREDLDYAIKNGGYNPETKSVFYDLLPKEVKVVKSSIATNPGDKIKSAEVYENYKNSGRDLLVVEVERTPVYTWTSEKESLIGHEGLKDTPSITFKALYSWRSVKDLGGKLTNYSAYRTGGDFLGNSRGFKGEPNDPRAGNNKTSNLAFTKKGGGLDEEGQDLLTGLSKDLTQTLDEKTDNDPAFVYSSVDTNFIIDVSSVASLNKEVDTTGTGQFSYGTEEDKPQNVYENANYTYRKSIAALNDSQVSNLILYDKLDGYIPTGDKNDYKDTQWRGTFVGVNTSQLADRGVNPVLYYSTRKDIVLDNSRDRSMNDLSDKTIWTKWDDRPANLNNRDVRAIALDVRKNKDGTDFVLNEGESFSYFINMKAPNLAKDLNDTGKPYVSSEEEHLKWFDSDRKVIDRDYTRVEVPAGVDSEGKVKKETLIFEKVIHESEEGLVGGAHSYNNAVATLDTINVGTGRRSKNQLIRHDYTKVGLKPYKIKFEKTWDDDFDRDGKRPKKVQIEVYANGKLYKTINVDEKDELNYGQMLKKEIFVPYRDKDGKVIKYTFKEIIPEGYELKNSRVYPEKDGLLAKFENKREPEKVKIKVNKKWTDLDKMEKAKRPKKITLVLKTKYHGEFTEELKRADVTPDEEGNWSYTFDNLFKYKNHGEIFEYKIEELPIEDFITDVKDKDFVENENDYTNNKKIININNTYYPYGDLVISKKINNPSEDAIVKNTFVYKLEITKNNEDKRVIGDYKAQKYSVEENKPIGKEFLVTNGSEIQLKDNEKVVIKDIDSKFTYTVEEKEQKGFVITGGAKRTGTIESSKASEEVYINDYQPKGTAKIELKKVLDGRRLFGNDFKFNVYETTGGKRTLLTPNPIFNNKYGEINYILNYETKDLEKSWRYIPSLNGRRYVLSRTRKTYEVEEVNEGRNNLEENESFEDGKNKYGFFYDPKKIKVTVDLYDDGGYGYIKTKISYNKEGWFNEDDQRFTFNNKYRAERPYELETFKYVKDGIKIKENQFKFSLTQVGVYENKDFKDPAKRKEYVEGVDETVHFGNYMNGKVVDEAYSDENGKAVFKKYDGKDFIFNQYDIGKTFVFDIKEIDNSANDAKVNFDGFTVRRYVSVYDGGFDSETKKGTLQIDESTEYIIDESSLDKAKADAKKIVEKYRREDAESIIKKIDEAESVEDVKKVLKETEGLFPLFVNEYKPGKIEVSKKVTKGDPNNPGKEFKFRIKLKGEDSKIPDGSLEMKRDKLPGYIPAKGWTLPEGSEDTADGFEINVQQQDGVDPVLTGEDEMGYFVGWDYGKNKDTPYTDSRIIKFYGEKKASDFKVSEAKEGQDLNKYLQSLLLQGGEFRDQIDWLVFNDNGIEKLIPKKSLKHSVSWSYINMVGLVDGDKTVTVDGKTYKIRLMKAYNDEINTEKGSEWNRMILPLIGVNGKEADATTYVDNPYGKFGYNTKQFVEQNMPTLASYNWWKDFGGNRTWSGDYSQSSNIGVHRWMQNYSVYRGKNYASDGAAYSMHNKPNNSDFWYGWQPVLEAVSQNPSNTPKATNRQAKNYNFKNTRLRKAYADESDSSVQKSESTISTGDPVWEVDSSDTENLTILFRNERPVLKISFDANGGSGSMVDIEYDNNIPEGTDVKFYRPNYRFVGWKFYHNGVEVDRSDLDSIPKPDKVIAKAEWEKRDLKVDFANGVGYFTLLDGENGYFDGIPANMDYEIEELTDEEWYNENPKYKDLSQEEKNKLIADAGWSLDSVENNKGKTLSDDTVSANFVNSFEPGKTKVTIEGLKTLNGKTTDVEGYNISLWEVDDSWNVVRMKEIVKTNKDGRFKFSDLLFDSNIFTKEDIENNVQSKTYRYVVNEVYSNKENIIYDLKDYKVEVKITRIEQNGEILLKSTVKYLDGDLVVKNKTEKTSLIIKKDFKSDNAKAKGQSKEFTVSVKLSDRANPVELKLNKNNNFTQSINDLEIGTEYQVSETNILNGFIEVSDKHQTGKTVKGNNEITITNDYSSSGTANVVVNKKLIGRPIKADEFTFQAFDKETGKPVGEKFTNTIAEEGGQANKVVLTIPLTESGTKTYIIKEEEDKSKEFVEFDKKPIEVTLDVVDNGDGTLEAKNIRFKDNKDTFVNKYVPKEMLEFTKHVENWYSNLAIFNFKLSLFDKEGTELKGEFRLFDPYGKETMIKSGDIVPVFPDGYYYVEVPTGTRYKIEEVNIPAGFKKIKEHITEGIVGTTNVGYMMDDGKWHSSTVSITNEYTSKGGFSLTGYKSYSHELKGNDFSFALMEIKQGKTKNDGFRPEDIKYFTNNEYGQIMIGPIAITRDELITKDSEGNEILNLKKRYRLVETKDLYNSKGEFVKARDPKIKYDNTVYDIELDLEDKDGEIVVKDKKIFKDGKNIVNMFGEYNIEFNNEYIEDKTSSISITKEVDNESPNLKDKPKFGMRLKLIYPDETEKVMNFSLEDKEIYTLDLLPLGTKYELEEIITNEDYRQKAIEVKGDLSRAKNRALDDLRVAGITSDIYLNKIKNAKTTEGVNSLRLELLNEDKEFREEKDKALDELEAVGITSNSLLNKIRESNTLEEINNLKKEIIKNNKEDNIIAKGIIDNQQVKVKVVNERKPNERVKIRAEKLLDGKATDKKFTFNLYEEGKETPIQTKENNRLLVDFDEITYENGLEDSKVYYIEEKKSNIPDGIIYDKRRFKVVVSKIEGSDELEVKYYEPDDNGGYKDDHIPKVVFENRLVALPSTGRVILSFAVLGLLLAVVTTIAYVQANKKERA